MVNSLIAAITFLIGLIISTIIIYIVTKLFREKEGIGRAFVTAIIGTIIFTIAYYLLGHGFLASIAGGIVWLLALRGLYDIGWIKALIIAVFVWISAAIIGILLPTATGPL